MELLNLQEFNAYIKSNFKKMFEGDEWVEFDKEFDGFCDSCHKDVFLEFKSRSYNYGGYSLGNLPRFITYFVECPRCSSRRFLQFVLIDDSETVETDTDVQLKSHYKLFLLYSLPTKDESFANKDIPDEYSILKASLAEALFTLAHGKYISSAIMFRRSLQILAKDVLGAKGRTLHDQLEWLKGNKNQLGIDLTNLFYENSKLIKNVGNQGAHLDDDVTLHNFTEEDVNALHDLFIVIVNDVFIKPAQLKAIQEDLIKNRKLKM